MYVILGKLFGTMILIGMSLAIGILLGRYSIKFHSWDEFMKDFFN